MKLNINTLTEEQRNQLSMGYKIYLNDNSKLVIEYPIKPYSQKFINFEKDLIEKDFQNTIQNLTSGYSYEDMIDWDLKYSEAITVLGGGISEYLNQHLINGETVEEFAKKIVDKANIFRPAKAEAERIKREKLKVLTI